MLFLATVDDLISERIVMVKTVGFILPPDPIDEHE
jgi:hypothetical protein